MKRIILLLACLVIFLPLATSCRSLKGYPKKWDTKHTQELDGLKAYWAQAIFTSYNTKLQTNEVEARRYRDEVISGRMRTMDIRYYEFERSFFTEQSASNIFTDWTLLMLNGATATITGGDTQKILAAISGGIVGGKASWDENVYFSTTSQALLTQMRALRDKVRSQILQSMQKDCNAYSLTAALIDLDSYFAAGTIPGALAAINESAGAVSIKAKEDMESLRKIQLTENQERVKRITGQIDSLSDETAMKLAQGLPATNTKIQELITSLDAGNKRATDHGMARTILKAAVQLGKSDDALLDKWEATLSAVLK